MVLKYLSKNNFWQTKQPAKKVNFASAKKDEKLLYFCPFHIILKMFIVKNAHLI